MVIECRAELAPEYTFQAIAAPVVDCTPDVVIE